MQPIFDAFLNQIPELLWSESLKFVISLKTCGIQVANSAIYHFPTSTHLLIWTQLLWCLLLSNIVHGCLLMKGEKLLGRVLKTSL